MSNIIELKNVTKKFKEQTALNDISIDFEEGKIHGIIGRNGSGKTVMMKCICSLMYPSDGTITVQGKKVAKGKFTSGNIGAIIEAPGFLPNYSGYKNLKFIADINKKISKDDIYNVMRLVELDPESKKHVSKYSLGMRQRLGIAQAIMESPDILILDEPMNGLDNDGVKEMRELFISLKNQGKTILLASHNREDISVLCDTVIELDHGKIIS